MKNQNIVRAHHSKRKNPSAGGDSYRIPILKEWAVDMGITPDKRLVKLIYENGRIIIVKEPE